MVTYMAMNTVEDVGKYRFFLTDAQNIFSHPLRFRIFLRGKSFSYKKRHVYKVFRDSCYGKSDPHSHIHPVLHLYVMRVRSHIFSRQWE